ncbi:hypothetical protein Efla_004241 [Eimeria flavescens]
MMRVSSRGAERGAVGSGLRLGFRRSSFLQVHAIFALLAVCAASAAASPPAHVTPLNGLVQAELEAKPAENSEIDSKNDGMKSEGDPLRPLQASLELRRLAAYKPRPVSRPKGVLTLLGALGLLGHAAYAVNKTWNTIPLRPAWMSLGIGRARFDTSNFAIYSLFAGLVLLYAGIKRRRKRRFRLIKVLREHLKPATAFTRSFKIPVCPCYPVAFVVYCLV